ncbi:efflux RND transporter periplasmic adaptor subunit [Neptunomonas concharum]|uniref:Efflux RND transporter periplasmic adaptor subunit n=1 Tax=Neptunomonas concharum TaxID=1031538 RepID=A0A5P1R907_9GAMM|nr:efflux RND transporter periplasmic adaptor subunit [Neptunomonas concharum]QEQ96114.1 efflux RND transporter periplasmic adaptor subunit [Neptunomonas concharum]
MKKALFLVLLVVSTGFLSGCDQPVEPAAVDAEVIRPAQIDLAISVAPTTRRTLPATIEASRHSALAFRVSGQLQALPVKAGDIVKEGALLAQLDQTDFKTVVDDRQARYQLAKVQYDQIKALIAKQYASQTRLDEASANLKAARAALSAAQDNLRYSRLIAPFDGVIAKVDIENFQAVQAQAPIIELQGQESVDIRFSIPETLLTHINPDIDASSICGVVRFDSQPDSEFNACYKKHDSVPDPLTRTYRVVFSMSREAKFPIFPGMSASIEVDMGNFLLAEGISGAVSVPIESVFETQGKSFVWRVTDQMQATRTEITLLKIMEDRAIIKGLDDATPIISAGVAYVKEGQKVRAINKERGL